MQNRRQGVRWRTERQAKIKIAGSAEYSDCQINDINFKGLQVCLNDKLTLDTYLKLSIMISNDFVLNVEAWVAWSKNINFRYVYGIYFTKIADQDREKIYQLIRNEFPEQINQQWWEVSEVEPAEKHPELSGIASEHDYAKGGEVMENENSEDRRIFARFSARFPLRFLNMSLNKEGSAQTFDISAKGMGLITNEELPARTGLEMWLSLPDKKDPLYTRGEVVWSKSIGENEYRAGINLEKADLMGLSRILRVI